MSFLKKVLGVQAMLNKEAAWLKASSISNKALALLLLFARNPRAIYIPSDQRYDFTIKDQATYYALVQKVETWIKPVRASEYIRMGSILAASYTVPEGHSEFRFEYAVDADSHKPYIMSAVIKPVKLWVNTSQFTFYSASGWVPGHYLEAGPQIRGDTEFDPTNWEQGPFMWEHFHQFPYR